jgi:hypothetical protein
MLPVAQSSPDVDVVPPVLGVDVDPSLPVLPHADIIIINTTATPNRSFERDCFRIIPPARFLRAIQKFSVDGVDGEQQVSSPLLSPHSNSSIAVLTMLNGYVKVC